MTNSMLGETIPILARGSKNSNTSSLGKYSESNYLRGRFPLQPLRFLANYALLAAPIKDKVLLCVLSAICVKVYNREG